MDMTSITMRKYDIILYVNMLILLIKEMIILEKTKEKFAVLVFKKAVKNLMIMRI